MTSTTGSRSALIGTLTILCLLSLTGSVFATTIGALERALTWILSTELLAPALVASLAVLLYFIRKSDHARRHTQ